MLHVAICDDEAAFVQHLSQLLDRYAQETGTELKISTFGDGAELLEPPALRTRLRQLGEALARQYQDSQDPQDPKEASPWHPTKRL